MIGFLNRRSMLAALGGVVALKGQTAPPPDAAALTRAIRSLIVDCPTKDRLIFGSGALPSLEEARPEAVPQLRLLNEAIERMKLLPSGGKLFWVSLPIGEKENNEEVPNLIRVRVGDHYARIPLSAKVMVSLMKERGFDPSQHDTVVFMEEKATKPLKRGPSKNDPAYAAQISAELPESVRVIVPVGKAEIASDHGEWPKDVEQATPWLGLHWGNKKPQFKCFQGGAEKPYI